MAETESVAEMGSVAGVGVWLGEGCDWKKCYWEGVARVRE